MTDSVPVVHDGRMESPATRFKELCLDVAGDDADVGRFWAGATGCEYLSSGVAGDPGDVVDADESKGIALCPVPEPKTVKNRVHLDLHTDSVDTLLALGASVQPVQDDADRWTVMLDPAGNELCAFVREPDKVPAYKVYEMVVDCEDAEAIGRWWADAFGVELQREEGVPWTWIEDVPGSPFPWVFGPVPEPKTVKNRLHWDLYGDVAELEARGATRLWEMPRWTVLADPEGNEFCVFPPPGA
jgi:hypothetical protein